MQNSTENMVIWDTFVRLFHWSVACLFLLNFWILEEGELAHEWVGYALGVLLILRIVWGFIGSHNARFIGFFPTPHRVCHHLLELKNNQVNPRAGHNPLGGSMVIVLLLMLSIVVVSGWLQTLDRFWGEDWVENLHETSAEIIMFLVYIHVAAVFIMGRYTGIPLIRTMITGKRKVIRH